MSGSTIPVGYVTPPFPSLTFHINSPEYEDAMLYYLSDMWRFTLYWTLIFFLSFHCCAALWASLMHRKVLGGLWMLATYALFAGVQAVISGSLVGLMISAVYRAGFFGMTTWIPMVWGAVQIIAMVVRSYSMMNTFL